MVILEFNTPPSNRPAHKKLKIALATMIIGTSLTLSTTLAANISLNNAENYEFGQGIVMTAACTGDDSLTVMPLSNFENSSGEFKLSAITFSHIPPSCLGVQFKVSIYSADQLLNLDTGVQVARVLYSGASTNKVYKGESGTLTFGAEITNASVADEYGTFTISLNGSPSSSLNIQKITLESSCSGVGTDSAFPGVSGYQIHNCNPDAASGLYWIQNENINDGEAIQIYVDMERDGGGWTLILANSNPNNWTSSNASNFNAITPPGDPLDLTSLNGNYSIVVFADYIKRSNTNFQYRIEASSPGAFGGVWTSNQNYSFMSQSNENTDITLNTKFGNWEYYDDGIEERMPYFSSSCGLLTTSNSPSGSWWGTLVSGCGWGPVPWIANQNPNPGIIWYWVK